MCDVARSPPHPKSAFPLSLPHSKKKHVRREWLRSCVDSPLLLPQQKRHCQYRIQILGFVLLGFFFTNSEIFLLSLSFVRAAPLAPCVDVCKTATTEFRANVFVRHR